MSRGSTPRHAQTAGDLGFAVQFNAGISHSSAILGSDNPQRNNRKGNSIHTPCERHNVIKHTIADYLRLPRPTPAPAPLAPLLSRGTGVHHWQSARRLWPDTRRLQLLLDDCCRLVLLYKAVHSIQQTEQIPNDPLRMGAKNTTTSNYPSTPNTTRSKVWLKILSGCVWCFNKRSLSHKMIIIGENYLIKDFFLLKSWPCMI